MVRERVSLAKRYCFSCAHWNPEGANFCENCGTKLPVRKPIQPHAGVNKWRVISGISITIIIILASGLLYHYTNYNQLRGEYDVLNARYNALNTRYNELDSQYDKLTGQYTNLNNIYNTLQNRYNDLSIEYNQLDDEHLKLQVQYSTLNNEYDRINYQYITLNRSFNLLLEANNKLRDQINNLNCKVATVYTYYAYVLRCSNDMTNFVWDTTHGCSSDDDFMGDLYQIHKRWVGMFQYDTNFKTIEPFQLIVGFCWNSTLPTGQAYVKDGDLDLIEEPAIYYTAPLIYKERKGVCVDFAITLAALYNYYIDITGKPYSVYCLGVVSPTDKNFVHECVLIKNNYGQVAIIDWKVITAIGYKVTFTSVNEAERLHQQYWKLELRYTDVFSRDLPWINKITFKNNDEFYAWVLGIPTPPR